MWCTEARCSTQRSALSRTGFRRLTHCIHTVYLGTVMRIVSAILWRVLLSNPWRITGSQEQILDLGVPSDRRVAMLSLPMIGDRLDRTVGDTAPHPGAAMKLKAAEMGTLLPWSIAVLEEKGTGVHARAELSAAARALNQWLGATRSAHDLSLSQVLVDSCQRCLANCERAGVHFVPKHHFFAHLSDRVYFMGNPKSYSCFWVSR